MEWGISELRGRDSELSLVRDLIDRRDAVVIIGPAGIGRSTLARTAVQGRTVRSGQALPAWSGRPAYPWLVAFDLLDVAVDLSSLAESVTRSIGTDEIVVLEDLQWADDRTLELVGELVGVVPILCTVQCGEGETSEVVERLRNGGARVIELGPLSVEDAAAVVRAANPDLVDGEVVRLAGLSGGRPLIARILARSADRLDAGSVAEPDGAAVAALVGRQSAAARRSLCALGLADGPLPAVAVEELHALRRAGLVVDVDDGRVAAVHPLVTDRSLLGLTPEDEAAMHRQLAALAGRGTVQRARHLLGADELQAAMSEALAAAAGPLDRAEQADALQLAAVAARRMHDAGSLSRRELDPMLVDAARALNDGARFAEAGDLLSGLPVVDGPGATPVLVELLRAAIGRGERARAEELLPLVDPLLEAATDADTQRLALLRGLLVQWDSEIVTERDGLRSVAMARVSAATDGAERSEAATAAGLVSYAEGADAAMDWFTVAREEAASSGAVASEFDATRNLVMVLTAVGRHAEAQELADASAAKAVELGERSWSLEFRTYAMLSRSHEQPDHDGLLSWMSYVRTAPVRLVVRAMAANSLAVLLADRGAVQRSADVLAPWLCPERLEAMEPLCQGIISWGGVQRAWIVGDLEQSIRLARWATRSIPAGFPSLAGTQVVWRWSEFELGRAITAPDPVGGLLPSATLEATAIGALAAGDHLAAVEGFERAAESWSAILPRCALRARWGAGHALALAGDTDAAVAWLERLDAELDDAWLPALRPRVQASLRLARGGRAGPEPRSLSGQVLSGRERQVMLLVVEGMTTNEIARRLGIGPATVDSHVLSARRKLGARTRIEAAAMVGLGG